jgi:hypothetical protein
LNVSAVRSNAIQWQATAVTGHHRHATSRRGSLPPGARAIASHWLQRLTEESQIEHDVVARL